MLDFAAEYRPFFIAACFLFAAMSLFQFGVAFTNWRSKQPVIAAFACLSGFAYLYPASLTAKAAVFGPEFFRWFIGDLGFVPFCSLAFAGRVFTLKRSPSDTFGARHNEQMVERLTIARWAMIFAFVAITLYELLMGVIYLTNPDKEIHSVGTTDPIDLVMYVLGLYLSLRLLSTMKRPIVQRLALALEAEAAEKALRAAKAHARKQANRKSNSRRRR